MAAPPVPPSPAPPRPGRRLLLALSLLGLALAGAGIWLAAAALRGRPLPAPEAEPLPRLGAVPDFALVERSGRQVSLVELRGRVWVADFIYTTCTDTCPLQTARMAALQPPFAGEPDFRQVSISVDPTHDTPPVLAAYAARFQADAARWLFLTGTPPAVYALVRDGFRLEVEDLRKAMEGRPAPPRPERRGQGPGGDGGWWMVDGGCPEASPARHAGGLDRLLRPLLPGKAWAHSDHAGSPLVHSARFVLVDRRAEIRGYYRHEDESDLARLRQDIRRLLAAPPA